MSTIHSKTGVKKRYKSFRDEFPAKVELAFLLQDWDDGYNVGGLFRVADACGAKLIMASGKTAKPEESPMIAVTSMGHHRRIKFLHEAKHEEAAARMIEEGYTLVAVEITDTALPYQEYEFPKKCCLVLGNEVNGVYTSVLKHCAAAVFIPQFGKGRSMNVHVAAAIVAFRAILG